MRSSTWYQPPPPMERLGLTDRAKDGLDALSHGNQKRVQLIVALVNEPDLLVLDEPFSGLDRPAMANMSELLAEVAGQGATVLFSNAARHVRR